MMGLGWFGNCLGYNGTYGWVGLALNLLVFLAVIWLVAWSVRRLADAGNGNAAVGGVSPLDILKVRYARGEISQDEYLNMRETLR